METTLPSWLRFLFVKSGSITISSIIFWYSCLTLYDISEIVYRNLCSCFLSTKKNAISGCHTSESTWGQGTFAGQHSWPKPSHLFRAKGRAKIWKKFLSWLRLVYIHLVYPSGRISAREQLMDNIELIIWNALTSSFPLLTVAVPFGCWRSSWGGLYAAFIPGGSACLSIMRIVFVTRELKNIYAIFIL